MLKLPCTTYSACIYHIHRGSLSMPPHLFSSDVMRIFSSQYRTRSSPVSVGGGGSKTSSCESASGLGCNACKFPAAGVAATSLLCDALVLLSSPAAEEIVLLLEEETPVPVSTSTLFRETSSLL